MVSWFLVTLELLLPLFNTSLFSLLCRKTKSTTPSPDFEIKGRSLIHSLMNIFSASEVTAQSKLYFMDLIFPSLYFVAKRINSRNYLVIGDKYLRHFSKF